MAEQVVLKVRADSDPRKVGSSLAHHLAEGKTVQLRAVGHGAVGQAVKGIHSANQWHTPRTGEVLSAVPGWVDVEGRDGGFISAITLDIRSVDPSLVRPDTATS